MFMPFRKGDKKVKTDKKNYLKQMVILGLGSTLAITICFFIYSGSALSSTSPVYVFKSELHCNNSTLSKEIPFSCSEANKIAMTKASRFEWNFNSLVECVEYYGKGNCGYNGKRRLSVKPAGFAFFPDIEDNLMPIYQSPALGLYLLPNGYPIKLGKTKIILSDDDNLSNLMKSKSLASRGCFKPKGIRVKCTSRYNMLSGYKQNKANYYLDGLEQEYTP